MKNNPIGLIIGAAVAIIVLASVLVPVVDDAQTSVGEEITLTNTSQLVMREIQPGDVLTVTRAEDRDVWAVNGEEINSIARAAVTWDVLLICDGVQITSWEHDRDKFGSFQNLTLDVPASNQMSTSIDWTVTITEDHVVIVGGSTTRLNVPWSFGFIACNLDEGQYCAPVAGGSVIVSSTEDIVLCGAYTSGANDTPYYYLEDALTVVNPAYTGVVDFDTHKHEGTTDIYDVEVSVDIGGESFVPYRVYVPLEVHGHATNGATSLLGALPVVVIVAVLVGIIGVAIRGARD